MPEIERPLLLDAHVHVTPGGEWSRPGVDASVARLIREMDSVGIGRCVVIALPGLAPNAFVADLVQKYPARFRGVGCVDFGRNFESQLREFKTMGLRAVKVHPRLQNVDLSGPTHEDLWRALNDARFPLVVDAYPQSATASVPIAHMLPFAYEEHVRKYTEIQFVLAHAGAHRVLDTYFLCRSLRNYHCDLSYTATALRGTSVEADMRFVVTNADRKVMFGSDFPEVSLAEALEAFRALCHGVAEEKRANVFARNAAALYWGEE